MAKLLVSPKAFAAIQTVDAEELAKLTEKELRPLLPCLVRMSLCSPLDQSSEWSSKRKIILRLLSGIELVNTLVALLSIDFHALEVDVKKEQQLRMKLGGHSSESILVSSLQNGPTLEFERSDAARKLRLLLSELLSIMSQIKDSRSDVIRHSELFDTDVFLEEVSDVLCIAKAELPGLLQMSDVAEALIRVKNGPSLLCRLVANSPDCFREVCFSLISNGEKQDEETVLGKVRMQTLRMLCQMNMSQALTIRAKAVEMCCMPGLAVHLTLDHCPHEQGAKTNSNTIVGDLVAFISGLLLGSDDKIRSWFAQYVRNCQKKTEGAGSSTLQQLRDELLQRLQNLVLFHIDHHNLPDCKVVQASALLRLYCALRGIAGLKFNDSEINVLLQLLTSHPPPSPAGIRFVSLGLCMMMACPSLLNSAEHENRGKLWIQWLVKEESYFGRVSGVSASFGEMLLLIAIHFHSNQINSIADLVCSTLGMRIAIRSNNLVRMKMIFTQEIFTDQVVTAHAVKVPVTPDLSRNTTGFLPVHCIHQLLKSRAFTKHKVPIKDWIYKQICNTIPPLHPVLPALIEVYVNSVLIPSSKGTHDTTNEPITEEEILAVFRNSVFMPEDTSKSIFNRSKKQDPQPMETDEKPASLTSQLLLLYYLLLYEDIRLSNMKTIISFGRKVKKYSAEFVSQLPIFYLLQQAQKNQQMYAGLFSPLLRLLATNFPHLCLVESWLAEEGNRAELEAPKLRSNHRSLCNKEALNKAFEVVLSSPFQLFQQLEHLLSLPLCQLWPYAGDFVNNLPKLLDPEVPRKVLEKSKQVWWKLNTIFPRRLWLMTVSALQPNCLPSLASKPLLLDNIILDPLHVLRCDKRIFRSAPLLEIVLHMLQAFLAASRIHLAHHMLEHPSTDKSGQMDGDKNREELRSALVAAQESAAVQILLECCRPTEDDKKCSGLLTELREVQSLICSHIHQVFISDPSLAKLVHFQGYPSELLAVTVSSIPSMHICLDFIPELLSQPHLDKQVFAIELASYLCIEYAIPKSLSIAKLCVNVAHTLLGVLPSEQQPVLYVPALPSLVRMCRAFPPLCEDVASLLLQLGNVCLSRACVINSVLSYCSDFPSEDSDKTKAQENVSKLPSNSTLSQVIRKSFAELCDIVVFNNTVY